MTAPRRATRDDLPRVTALQRAAYVNNRAILGVEPLPLLADYEQVFADYEIYLAERPYIYLWHPALIYGVSRRIEGFRLVPDGMIRLGGLKGRG